ncbi:hypothetical protein [Nostoc sp.]|uniref:hypothetical protein n=1 Tax=Nostoc sp. TaxID=1180 RepID=UPI002FF7B63A
MIFELIDFTNTFYLYRTEFRSQESGVRSQESGVRSQESGVRSQESGVRIQQRYSVPLVDE